MRAWKRIRWATQDVQLPGPGSLLPERLARDGADICFEYSSVIHGTCNVRCVQYISSCTARDNMMPVVAPKSCTLEASQTNVGF